MRYLQIFWVIAITALLAFSACYQSDPPPFDPNAQPIDSGDIWFSGYGWDKKASGFPVGPGPNVFSASEQNIWLDANGFLHLKIDKENNVWKSAEVISTMNMSYGTYIFTVESDLTKINEKMVLGLFTWDDSTFFTHGNSEVDIEFSRWNNPADSLILTYSVQPVIFDNPVMYQERTYHPLMNVSKLKTTTTHAFTWNSTEIKWESYAGDNYPGTQLLASWKFDLNNQPRTKIEGGKTSDPIIIPGPGKTTNARINLWLLGGQAPSDGKPFEVIIKRFKYLPL